MPFPAYAPPTQAGTVTLHLRTTLDGAGVVTPLTGSIGYALVTAAGVNVASGDVDVSELTPAQRSSMTSLMTTIRNRINTEVFGG